VEKRSMILVTWLLLLGLTATACGADSASPPAAKPPEAAVPLASQGPYGVGAQVMEVVDPSREGRSISYTVWYPAITDRDTPTGDAPPDRAGAPYPVVLTSLDFATESRIGSHFVSHGYVLVATRHPANDGWAGTWVLDTAVDRVFALDALDAATEETLAGLADTSSAAVVDYSNDTIIGLALAGARIDPGFYRTACANAGDQPPFDPALTTWDWGDLMAWNCMTDEEWQAFTEYGAELGVASADGLWASLSDERIKAVIPAGPEGAWLYGEEGLGAASVPTLLWAGSEDDVNVYAFETGFLQEHLGSPTDLITVVGGDHFSAILDLYTLARFRLFATAFFDLHLKGDTGNAGFFTQQFIEDDLPALDLGVTVGTAGPLELGFVEP
jgi:predicted dienelactone hydrolase